MTQQNELTELLRPHVAALQKDAGEGCNKARMVIDLYQMYVAQPHDPGAPALCRSAFAEWNK